MASICSTEIQIKHAMKKMQMWVYLLYQIMLKTYKIVNYYTIIHFWTPFLGRHKNHNQNSFFLGVFTA